MSLGDARLNRRAVGIGARMAAMPGASLPKMMENWAQCRAAYRLLSNAKVSHEKLSLPHWEATRQQAAQEAVVLLVQDTSYLTYNHYAKTMRDLGQFTGEHRGLLLHSTLAVVPEPRRVLGLAHQQVFTPVLIPEGQTRHTRPEEARRTRLWAGAVNALGVAPQGSCQVVVADREGDEEGLLLTCRGQEYHFLIRARHDRRLVTADGERAYSLSTARSWEAQGSTTLPLPARSARPGHSNEPARPKQEARTAQLRLSWGKLLLRVGGGRSTETLTVWMIRVWEVNAPAGAKPLEWLLMSSLPVTTLEEALQRVQWYTCRWSIEDYHQCLKTGCTIEERDFEKAARIERLLGFLGPVAVRLLQLRDQSRLNPDLPASLVADESFVRILAAKQKVSAEELTVRAFWRGVAQLGGFLGRRRDGEPGWKSIWTGWLYLQNLVEGAALASALATD